MEPLPETGADIGESKKGPEYGGGFPAEAPDEHLRGPNRGDEAGQSGQEPDGLVGVMQLWKGNGNGLPGPKQALYFLGANIQQVVR